MAGTDVGKLATVVDPRNHEPPATCRWLKIALFVTAATLGVALVISWVRYFAQEDRADHAEAKCAVLQKRAERAEQAANERGEEIRQMARQLGQAARISLERLGDPEEDATDEGQAKESAPRLDGGADSLASKTGK